MELDAYLKGNFHRKGYKFKSTFSQNKRQIYKQIFIELDTNLNVNFQRIGCKFKSKFSLNKIQS